jgi:hypothetical protein
LGTDSLGTIDVNNRYRENPTVELFSKPVEPYDLVLPNFRPAEVPFSRATIFIALSPAGAGSIRAACQRQEVA